MKELIVVKSLITKQCAVELSVWIITSCIPHLTKNVFPPFILLVAPTMCWPPYPFPKTYRLEQPCRWGGKSYPAAKKKCSFPTPEIPPSPNCDSQYKLHLWLWSLLFYHFLAAGFMYRYIVLILISRQLLNLICSITKALNGQNSSKQNSQTPTPHFNAIWKTLPQLSLVFLLTSSIFRFKLYKFLLILLQMWLHSLQVD